MTLSAISVKRKIAMCAFILMLVFLGFKVYREIAIDNLPKFNVPYVQVTTIYPGASPEEVETDVAKRVEDAVASLDGIKHITSICMENVCATTLEFNLGVDVDTMIHEVREKLNLISDDFPSLVETPKLAKVNVNAVSVVSLYLTGSKSVDELYDYADETLSDMFASIQGVGEVQVHGGNDVQLHVLLDRQKLAESNLSIAEIVSRIKSANLKLPAGHIREYGTELNITYDGEYRDIQALKDLEISSTVGKHIYLGDIADIKLMSKEIRQLAYLNGEPAVQMEIVKKSDANAAELIDNVRKRYEEIIADGTLPGAMRLHWFKDSGAFIHSSVEDAWESIILGIALTAVILFFFLHDLRSTFIVVISMPVSIIITFVAVKLLNYSFNMMTLVSLGCSAGVLVTNSVVVLENIFKRMHAGEKSSIAAVKGTDEVVNAVAASALTNVVVFVPVALMASVVGLLISPFAGVMVIATLASLFVSFTLTPILASYFFKHGRKENGKIFSAIFKLWDILYNALEIAYGHTIEYTRKGKWIVIILIVGISFLMCMVALPKLSISFFPTNDKSQMNIRMEFPVNYDLEHSRELAMNVARDVMQRTDVEDIATTIGYMNAIPGQVSEGVYIAGIDLHLIDKDKRKSVFTIADEIRTKLKDLENVKISVNTPAPTGQAGAELAAYITGPDYDILKEEGMKAARVLFESGKATEIDTSVRPSKPRINIVPDRPVLRNLGLTETLLGTSVLGYFDGITAGTYKIGTRTYDIRVKAVGDDGLDSAKNIVLGAAHGTPLNIDVLAEFESSPVTVCMMRQDKERSVWIYCNPANDASLGDVVSLLRNKIGKDLPHGYKLSFFGQAELMEDGADEFKDVFLIAIVLTYLLIAAIMESWSRPFLILFTIPLGFVGLVFTMFLAGKSLSMVTLLGGVMMIGIVVNNAILIMDEVAVLRKQGMLPHDAMLVATRNKFRPIVMTSLASVIGMLPMAFGTGLGSELRSSCGIGVVGGLTYASIMTIYLIPALYFAFVRNRAQEPSSKATSNLT